MKYRLGAFEIDEQRFELRRNGELVPLQRRSFDLLLCLVKKRGIVVTKEELLDDVWSGVAVTKDALPQAMMAVRNALGDDVENPMFIQTVRGRGYRFLAADEGTSLAPPSPPAQRRVPIVGRAVSILATLRERLDNAATGNGRLVLVTGGAGMGKTRLLEELTRARSRAQAISVRCHAGEGTPALWPFAQALREIGRSGALLDPRLVELANGDPASLDDPEDRFRIFDLVVQALGAFAERTPLLLAIDDFHLAGASSGRLLDLLATRLPALPLLVVAAYNPATSLEPGAQTALAAIAHEPATSVLVLEPFRRSEVAEYLERAMGRPPSEAIVDKVFEKTNGNPLFVSELAHVLKAKERLRSDVTTGSLLKADSMSEAIIQLLATHPEIVTRVLEVASVFGRSFSLAPLAAALETTNAEVLSVLDVAHAERVIAPSGPGGYRFTYPLVRDVLYARLTPSERARLHGCAARALEDHLAGSDEYERIGEIAGHLVEAAAIGDVGRAVDMSLLASDLAQAAGAHGAASKYAERGLDACRFARKPDAAKRERLLAACRRPT